LLVLLKLLELLTSLSVALENFLEQQLSVSWL